MISYCLKRLDFAAMNKRDQFLHDQLRQRDDKGLLRTLPLQDSFAVDFASNDFLGLATNETLKQSVFEAIGQNLSQLNFGSTGSRLVTGNHLITNETEQFLSHFFQSPAALLFKSGFEANSAVFGYLPLRQDLVLYDSEIHASIRTSARLSGANCRSFRHNDLKDLLSKGRLSGGKVFVAVESVYSISGHKAPLTEIAAICEENQWYLIVDEAHTTGIYGQYGEGCCVESGISDQVFARIHTFGKAVGCGGAVVTGSNILKEYLMNFAVPFIYSTAMPPIQALVIRLHLEYLQQNPALRKSLNANVEYFGSKCAELEGRGDINELTHIQPLTMPGAELSTQIAQELGKMGFLVKAMRPPTTPNNESILRITLHSGNNFSQIDDFFNQLRKLF